tara:strand:+ start:3955 stop:4302 length:348 start_codon:yes stop_codon:yes gene_type:complete
VGKDVITRILEKGVSLDNELASFLDDGVSSILTDRRDPYFTIAKQKIKSLISHGEARAPVDYTNKMITRLIELESNLPDITVDSVFVEICLEHVRDKHVITREALVLLNHIHKSL